MLRIQMKLVLALAKVPLVCAVFIGFCVASASVAATEEFTAAGVLLIARQNGVPYVLLGRDRHRPWFEMLGGRRESSHRTDGEGAGRQESAYETAIRECYEESRGYLEPELLRRLIDPAIFIRDGDFVFFFALVDKFPLEDIIGMTTSGHEQPSRFQEIVEYAWVPVESALAADGVNVLDEFGRRIRVRRQLKSRLGRARGVDWF